MPSDQTQKRKIKIRKIAAGIVAGKTGTQAAIDAGYSPAYAPVVASTTINSPEGKAEIARLLEKEGLGKDRAIKELKKGLERGRIGSHDTYLDRLLELNEMTQRKDKGDTQNVNLFLAFAENLKTRGFVELDGSITRPPIENPE